jgi:hypothetical protein
MKSTTPTVYEPRIDILPLLRLYHTNQDFSFFVKSHDVGVGQSHNSIYLPHHNVRFFEWHMSKIELGPGRSPESTYQYYRSKEERKHSWLPANHVEGDKILVTMRMRQNLYYYAIEFVGKTWEERN